jgi:hypothetical protein
MFLGGLVFLLILLIAIIDIIFVIRDLLTSGRRLRAVFAVVLWFPIFFLISMMQVWEGPLYIAITSNPLRFQIRGLAMFCSLSVYGPEQERAEWSSDDIGLIWAIDHKPNQFPFDAQFNYGDVPNSFVQTFPAGNLGAPSQLDPTVNYKLVVGRCMGGPEYFTLHDRTVSEYKPSPNVCWGELTVPERETPAWVRVDCKTRHPLPMSDRAKDRLEAYREKKISYY